LQFGIYRVRMRPAGVCGRCPYLSNLARSALAIYSLTMLILAAPARADRVDDIVFREMSAQHIPGLALAVMRDDKVLRFGGYGQSNIESRTPVTSKTVFAISVIFRFRGP
jgi:CubicO group peptidase (beta-lactamase class C family)